MLVGFRDQLSVAMVAGSDPAWAITTPSDAPDGGTAGGLREAPAGRAGEASHRHPNIVVCGDAPGALMLERRLLRGFHCLGEVGADTS
jgi:hypothetical protein